MLIGTVHATVMRQAVINRSPFGMVPKRISAQPFSKESNPTAANTKIEVAMPTPNNKHLANPSASLTKELVHSLLASEMPARVDFGA